MDGLMNIKDISKERKERQRLRDLALNEVLGSLSYEKRQAMVDEFFRR